MPAIQRTRRPRAVIEAPFQSAAACIGRLDIGCRLTGVTCGQFSLLDLIAAVLEQTGPADVTVSTWTTGIRDVVRAAWLLESGSIRSFALLTDRSFPQRQPAYCRALVDRFGEGAIRSTRTHAKFAVIRNDVWSICIRSSMNLNTNPRFEQFDLDDDAALCAFFDAHFAAQPLGFDEVAVAEQWQGRDAAMATAREKARLKIAEAKAKRVLAAKGVV